MNPVYSQGQDNPWSLTRNAAYVILAGLILRILTSYTTVVVNTDAIFYIQQAKALHLGLYDLVIRSQLPITNYSIFIVLAYKIFGDWIVAASAVSIFFGTLTLVPLYWLLRRFFDDRISTLSLLLMALSPSFIRMSTDVIRGPVSWFFLAMAIFLFVLQLEKKSHVLAILSCLSFLFAAWARIEALSMVMVSALYLMVTQKEYRWRRLFFFLLPIIVISMLIFVVNLIFFRREFMLLIGFERILQRVTDLPEKYQMIRDTLRQLGDQQYPGQITRYFFKTARELVWLIALFALIIQIVRALYEPFFLIFLTGILSVGRQHLKDIRFCYLVSLSCTALIVLYVQIIYLWAVFSRWIALFVIPAFIFMGFGIQRLEKWVQKRQWFKRQLVYGIICLLIIGVALPKVLRFSGREEKYVFAEIGKFISDLEKGRRAISVAGVFKEIILIDFYANLNFPGASPFNRESILEIENKKNLKMIKEKGFNYFVWDEKDMGSEGTTWLQAEKEIFIPVGQWQSSKLGKLILYKIESGSSPRNVGTISGSKVVLN